ncbi:MAG TPA: hypothetical protein VGF24_20590 [Vicinamibacterales bacterium]
MNGRQWLPLVSVVALCCMCPATVNGQERKGFWASVDIGVGSAEVSVGGDGLGRGAAGAADIGLGWALNPRMLVGMAIGGGFGLEMTTPAEIRNTFITTDVVGTLTFFPRPASGLFVRGGVGRALVSIEAEESDPIVSSAENGVSWTMGTGYDRYLGRGFSLTPAVDFWYGRAGRIVLNGEPQFDHWAHNFLQVTIGIRFN